MLFIEIARAGLQNLKVSLGILKILKERWGAGRALKGEGRKTPSSGTNKKYRECSIALHFWAYT